MPLMVYCLVWLSLFKLVFDIVTWNLFAPYSVLLENLQVGLVMGMIILAISKQRRASRESMTEKVEKLRKRAERSKV